MRRRKATALAVPFEQAMLPMLKGALRRLRELNTILLP